MLSIPPSENSDLLWSQHDIGQYPRNRLQPPAIGTGRIHERVPRALAIAYPPVLLQLLKDDILLAERLRRLEGQLLQKVRHSARVGHLVARTGIDYHTDGAELAKPILRRDPQSIGKSCHLGVISLFPWSRILDRGKIRNGL